jgi:rifampicin phosphotransferase
MSEPFQQPGPGGWRRLADHFPKPVTAEFQRIYSETFRQGTAAFFADYGVVAAGADVDFVHGHPYVTPLPLLGSLERRRKPRRSAVWLLSRVHPEFRRRAARARTSLAERPWRAVTDRWFAEERASWLSRSGALEAEDPGHLTVAELIRHIEHVRELVIAGYRRHFELHGDDLLPSGLLIVRGEAWGLDAATMTAALAGATVPRSEPVPDWQLVTGYDLDSLAWCELPGQSVPERAVVRPRDLRPGVPEAERDELDALVVDARRAVALREDNGAVLAAWPMGLLRRGMLEAGRRLELPGLADALELTVEEVVEALRGSHAERAAFARRAALRGTERRCAAELHAPRTLGPPFELLPLDLLPGPLATIASAQLAATDHVLEDSSGPVGVGDRSYTGRALVVHHADEAMERVQSGDVVVTAATSPTWNLVLAEAGALVTTTGGLMSHAAIIARELGIPAVIGDDTADRRLSTGETVTVDPRRALVTKRRPRSAP